MKNCIDDEAEVIKECRSVSRIDLPFTIWASSAALRLKAILGIQVLGQLIKAHTPNVGGETSRLSVAGYMYEHICEEGLRHFLCACAAHSIILSQQGQVPL